jgi:hypothetical protein
LKETVLNYEKARWKYIGKEMGKSDVGCRKLAKEMGIAG